jgi:hypothetical protein
MENLEGKGYLENIIIDGRQDKDILMLNYSQSQWPRGLRHEMSSPARTLGSWFRVPLEAWLYAFILCLCCPV